VCAGNYFTCALHVTTTVYCSGQNGYGQLGTGDFVSYNEPLIPVGGSGAPLSGVAQIACGGWHAAALRDDGALYTWGWSNYGQVGRGTSGAAGFNSPGIVLLPGIFWASVAAGGLSTCAISTPANGSSLFCWGVDGAVGKNTTAASPTGTNTPTLVRAAVDASLDPTGFVNRNIVSVTIGPTAAVAAAAPYWTWARNSSGALFGWGLTAVGANSYLGFRTDCSVSNVRYNAPRMGCLRGAEFTSVSAGYAHFCGIKTDASLVCWGRDVSPGTYLTGSRAFCTPAGACDPAAVIVPGQGASSWIAVRAGQYATCGILAGTNAMYCWGGSVLSPLPIGMLLSNSTDATTAYSSAGTPLLLAQGAEAGKWADAAVGAAHICGLSTAGTIFCGGDFSYGQWGVGLSTQTPAANVAFGANVAAVGLAPSGAAVIHALSAAGRIQTMGTSSNGRLGVAGVLSAQVHAPLQLGAATAPWSGFVWTRVITCVNGGCGLLANKSALCWGNNAEGEAGNGGITQVTVPTLVVGGLLFDKLACSSQSTCGLQAGTGAIWCWGSNAQGQLGIGVVVARRTTPTLVVGGHTFTDLAMGGLNACGIHTNTSVLCWGWDNLQQVGHGGAVRNTVYSPVLAGWPLTATAITVGYRFTCIVTPSTALACWGMNPGGQFCSAVASVVSSPYATIATAGTGWVSLSASQANGVGVLCGLLVDGSVRCCGDNARLLVGNADAVAYTVPTAPTWFPGQPTAGYSSITVGGSGAACATHPTAGLFCWGSAAPNVGVRNGVVLAQMHAPATPSSTRTPSATSSVTRTSSATPSNSGTPSATPSETRTPSTSRTASGTPTVTRSGSRTSSLTQTPSRSPSQTPVRLTRTALPPARCTLITPQPPTRPRAPHDSKPTVGHADTDFDALHGRVWVRHADAVAEHYVHADPLADHLSDPDKHAVVHGHAVRLADGDAHSV
jgi:alpha-tubulin suppressor-like RCC1 family protein